MNYARNRLLNKKLPSYTGFFVLLAALGITLLLSGNAFIFVSRATVGSDPKNVQISNLSDSSFTISFTTDTPTVGTISYGADPSTLSIALDDRASQSSQSATYQIHFITVKNLAPATKYYYVIDSDDQKLTNNGSPFEITTDPPLLNPPADLPTLAGNITMSDGSIPKEGVVYLTTDNAQQLAGFVTPDGSYQIPLNTMRDGSGSDAASLTPQTIMQIQAVTPTETSLVKLLESQASHVPKIALSQDYDFTLTTSPTPSASGSGVISNPVAAFPLLATPATATSPEITTPTDQEAFSMQQPTFQGRALPSTEVDITIQSQQEIQATLQSDATGSWQFKPPLALAPGKHTITIKSVNASGVLQTISRSFTVYAAGSKFVEPSVSPIQLSPSPDSSASATPTVAATPTAAVTPTPTVAITPTSVVTPTGSQNAPTADPNKSVPKTGSSIIITGILAAITTIGIGGLLFFIL